MSNEQQQIDELRASLQASEERAKEYRERADKYTADLLHRDKQREEALENFQKSIETQAETHRKYVAAQISIGFHTTYISDDPHRKGMTNPKPNSRPNGP